MLGLTSTKAMRNPVAKYNNLINKPQTHRNKKKDYRRKGKFPDERDLRHPAHDPYKRTHTNLTHAVMIDGLGEEDED